MQCKHTWHALGFKNQNRRHGETSPLLGESTRPQGWMVSSFLTRGDGLRVMSVSFWLASFSWQNHYHVMLLLSQGCRIFQSLQIFRLYFSDVEIAVLWQVTCVTSFMKAILVFKEDSMQIPTQRSRIPTNHPDDVLFPSERSSVSNIRPDDENFPSGRPSVSRNFKLFKSASVWTMWQYCPDAIQCSSRNLISCPTTYQETATVWTEGQHHPDAFQASRKIYAHVLVFLS
jgi:hypothetical protein